MLFWIVLLAHHSLCSPISYSQAQVAKTPCTGTSLLVRDSNWCQGSESFSATLDFTHSQNASFQRRQFSGKDTEKDCHNDRHMEKQSMASKCRLEMLCLSSDEQKECRILSTLWWLLGRMCPRTTQWMDMGKRTPPITKKAKCEQTEQTQRKLQRKVGQRQIWKTNRRIAIAIWTVYQYYSNLALASVRHLALYQLSGQGDRAIIAKLDYNNAYPDDRFGYGSQKGISRWFRASSWCKRSTGEVRSSRSATNYSRPTQCHYSTRQSTQSVERSSGSQKIATQQLDSTLARIYHNVGDAARPIQTFLESTSRGRDESNSRHCCSSKGYPEFEQGCRIRDSRKRRAHSKTRKRRDRFAKAVTYGFDKQCSSYWHYVGSTHRDCHLRYGKSRRKPCCEKAQATSAWRSCSTQSRKYNVSVGRVPPCPGLKGRHARPKRVSFVGVEAYEMKSPHAASSDQSIPMTSFFHMKRFYDDEADEVQQHRDFDIPPKTSILQEHDFLSPFAAGRQACNLRWNNIHDSIVERISDVIRLLPGTDVEMHDVGAMIDIPHHDQDADDLNDRAFFVFDDPMLLLDHLHEFSHQQQLEIVSFGLHGQHCGRRSTTADPNIEDIRRQLQVLWNDYTLIGTTYVYMIRPQIFAHANQLHLLIEFFDTAHRPEPGYLPVVRRIFRHDLDAENTDFESAYHQPDRPHALCLMFACTMISVHAMCMLKCNESYL